MNTMGSDGRRPGLVRGGLVLFGALLAGCAPMHPPVPPAARVEAPAAWRAAALSEAPVMPTWWQAFGDARLNALVERALANNTDVLTAMARVDEARAQARLAAIDTEPRVDGVLSAQRSQALSTSGVAASSTIQPGLQVSYEADVWGRLRDLRDAAALGAQATQTDLQTVRLAVAATVARSYVQLLALDRQLQVTRSTVKARADALRIARDRAELGYTSQLELTQAEAEHAAAEQLIPGLEQQIADQENAIRLLSGDPPGPVARAALDAELATPATPGALPARLLERRPDLYAAQARLAASDATLAAERTRFFPQVQLSASLGRFFASGLNFDPATVWSLGGSVLAPLFDRGRLSAGMDVATARRDQAAYAYRAAALRAFKEVEAALLGIQRYDAEIARAGERREVLARSLEIARDRYRAGYSSYLAELDAQRTLFDVELALVQLRAARHQALIDLYQALGGGWSAAPAPGQEPGH